MPDSRYPVPANALSTFPIPLSPVFQEPNAVFEGADPWNHLPPELLTLPLALETCRPIGYRAFLHAHSFPGCSGVSGEARTSNALTSLPQWSE